MWARVKTWFVFLFFLSFLLSGILINLIQLVIYVLLYPLSKKLYRRINYYLIYTSWSQIVAAAEWWSGSKCNIYGDEETLKHFGKEHSIVVMNHKYDVDWLMTWLTCDKLHMLGSAKTFAKKSLKKVPVIGWGWVFAEMIFLERNWNSDSLVIGQQLDNLFSYQDPMMLLLFSEGTRFTPEKHKASMEFARKRNLPQLRHHLLPRAKGFNFCVRYLKGKMAAIYDVQLAFPRQKVQPTFFNILSGKPVVGEMYVRRIPLKEIPTESDEECSSWLYRLYQHKDEVIDDYLKTEKFPGRQLHTPRRIYPLINWIFWLITVGTPVIYSMFKMLTSGNTVIVMIASTVIIIVFTATYFMIGVTKATKGSSYGKSESENASSKNGVVYLSSGDKELFSLANNTGAESSEEQPYTFAWNGLVGEGETEKQCDSNAISDQNKIPT